MAYKMPAQKYSGQIQEVTIGPDLKLGGESVLPFTASTVIWEINRSSGWKFGILFLNPGLRAHRLALSRM